MASKSFKFITKLCDNSIISSSESEVVGQLKRILATDPGVAHELYNSLTLLHYAAESRSVEFCKLLIEKNPNAVRVADNQGRLPFHEACFENNVETAKYLFEMYPECIDIADSEGDYPIHYICCKCDSSEELFQFLLDHDQGAVAKPNIRGYLPFHLACYTRKSLDIVKLLFNAYPEAVYIDVAPFGHPLEYFRRLDMPEHASFFKSQLNFVRQAKEDTIQDGNGMLPIHRLLPNRDLSLGAVKMMVKANPSSANVADNLGCFPLHIAVNRGDIGIVKYFIKTSAESLMVFHSRGNCALHYACLAGKYDVINSILETSSHGSSVRNSEENLPIQLLLCKKDCNRKSVEYMEAVYSLLKAHPNLRDIATFSNHLPTDDPPVKIGSRKIQPNELP